MSLSQDKTPPRPYRRIAEEDRAWCHLYRSARDPAVAAEVVQHLRNDAEAARCHLALYLCCRQTLRTHKARMARHQRIGRVMRRFFRALLSSPAAIVRKLLGNDEARLIRPTAQLGTPRALQRIRDLPGRIELAQGIPLSVEPGHMRSTATSSGPESVNSRAARVA
jgi:hypothetical protein